MGNKIQIRSTEFTDIQTGVVTKGFTVFDDYAANYDNSFAEIPSDNLEALRQLAEKHPVNLDDIPDGCFPSDGIRSILHSANDCQDGITINGVEYPWDVIRQIIA